MDMDIASAFVMVKEALGLAKAAKDLLPDSPQREASDLAFDKASRAVELAEAQIAEQLGFDLCKCSFPPAISLRQPDGTHRCPKCGRNTDEDHEPVMGVFD